jgi:uncharacterized membrane protein required for colicin V production
MTILDIFLAILFVVAIVLGSLRGLGLAALDLLALYSALMLAGAVSPIVAHSVPTITSTPGGFANCELVTFVVIAGIFLLIAKFSYSALLWNAGMFERMGGAVAGAAAGIVFCHAVVAALAVGDSQQASALSGALSQQLLTFSSYHELFDGMKAVITPGANNS